MTRGVTVDSYISKVTHNSQNPTSTDMRAVLVNNQESGAEKLYIGEVETPEPENEQVLVKV
jgi:hypothetical protein